MLTCPALVWVNCNHALGKGHSGSECCSCLSLKIRGCSLDYLQLLDYSRQDERFNSLRVNHFSVESQSIHFGKQRRPCLSVYGTWKLRIKTLDEMVVHRVHVLKGRPMFCDRNARDCVVAQPPYFCSRSENMSSLLLRAVFWKRQYV